MHDDEFHLDPKMVEKNNQIIGKLEAIMADDLAAIEALFDTPEPGDSLPNAVFEAKKPLLRKIGGSILRFFTKEEILFFRIIEDKKPSLD